MNKTVKLSKVELLNEFLKDPERKPTLKILTEILSLALYHRSFPLHYFSRYLFKKNKTNIKDYYPSKSIASLKPIFIDENVIHVLENKLFFNLFYGQFDIRIPKIIMYNHKKMFVVGKNYFEIKTIQSFEKLLQTIFKKNPTYESIFIKKTYSSFGGNNIFKLSIKELNSDFKKIENIYNEITNSGFLFQETIKQHTQLIKLNPSCINSIRLDTFIDNKGNINVISGFIRLSITNSHVDNVSSGGCFVGLNINKGILKGEGFQSIKRNGVKILDKHPITKITFKNFEIPFIDEAKELVTKAASLMPALRLVGWDVAIGEYGPILIEGNTKYNARSNDLAEGGYGSNEIFRKILQEIKQNKN